MEYIYIYAHDVVGYAELNRYLCVVVVVVC